ncbi:hypothetical protein M0R36_11225 [bacterium]|jgi:hypothetical protein|nr:hypothetical protein [bacterium]
MEKIIRKIRIVLGLRPKEYGCWTDQQLEKEQKVILVVQEETATVKQITGNIWDALDVYLITQGKFRKAEEVIYGEMGIHRYICTEKAEANGLVYYRAIKDF